MIGTENIDARTGLNDGEKKCLDALVDSFNEFARMERQHPDELRDFTDGIHSLQNLLTVRIARREYPKGWPTYKAKDKLKIK